MDPTMRTGLIIFAGVTIKSMLFTWWEAYKERKAKEAVPLKERNGVYVPWGPVQRIQRFLHYAFLVWLAYMAVLIVLLIAFKTGLWGGF